ncbi:MAG: helix-turn-helix domain-containing protein [Gemmataceae bacterium]
MDGLADLFDEVVRRLGKIEEAISLLGSREPAKAWFTPEELATRLGKSPFTAREWCRHGRIKAKKRSSGRGSSLGWIISREEVERIEREGLLPISHFKSNDLEM